MSLFNKGIKTKKNQFRWTHAVDLNSYILNGRKEYDLNQTERDAINSTLLQAYSCAFEYYKELSKITARPMKTEFYHQIIVCLAGWSEYVLRTLQCIKKSTPNWVLAPLNYFVSLPASSFEVYLSDEDRASFAATVHKCLSHLRSISQKGIHLYFALGYRYIKNTLIFQTKTVWSKKHVSKDIVYRTKWRT